MIYFSLDHILQPIKNPYLGIVTYFFLPSQPPNQNPQSRIVTSTIPLMNQESTTWNSYTSLQSTIPHRIEIHNLNSTSLYSTIPSPNQESQSRNSYTYNTLESTSGQRPACVMSSHKLVSHSTTIHESP